MPLGSARARFATAVTAHPRTSSPPHTHCSLPCSQSLQSVAGVHTEIHTYKGFPARWAMRSVRLMRIHDVRTRRSADDFPRGEHLAWKIAEVATDPVAVEPETAEMVINRIIDNAAVSAASVVRRPVTVARQQALAHPGRRGAKVFGVAGSYSSEWAAWANGVAVRELDFHDTFLAAEYSHPGDNIPPLVAVAQQLGVAGAAPDRYHVGAGRPDHLPGGRTGPAPDHRHSPIPQRPDLELEGLCARVRRQDRHRSR